MLKHNSVSSVNSDRTEISEMLFSLTDKALSFFRFFKGEMSSISFTSRYKNFKSVRSFNGDISVIELFQSRNSVRFVSSSRGDISLILFSPKAKNLSFLRFLTQTCSTFAYFHFQNERLSYIKHINYKE